MIFDQHDLTYACGGVTWGASGGKIDERGLFVAEAVGSYVIRAKVEAVEATAEAQVTKEAQPPPPPAERGLTWRGKVPAQKWMNFYTKVVSRFASAPGLELEDADLLVTHNAAILGVLGAGKSFLALELVERMMGAGIKVICLDLTHQYAKELAPFYDEAAERAVLAELQAVGVAGTTFNRTWRTGAASPKRAVRHQSGLL